MFEALKRKIFGKRPVISDDYYADRHLRHNRPPKAWQSTKFDPYRDLR